MGDAGFTYKKAFVTTLMNAGIFSAGSNKAISNAMTDITTRSSIKVKARLSLINSLQGEWLALLDPDAPLCLG